jgi:hypothetical protein
LCKRRPVHAAHLWLLPPLFALWVNLDGWFLLGPLCVGLHLLGEVLQDAVGPARRRANRQRRSVAGCSAPSCWRGGGCLLNRTTSAFTLPTELSPAPGVEVARTDERLSGFFPRPSPSGSSRPTSATVSPAGLLPIGARGLVSFALNRAQPRWNAS